MKVIAWSPNLTRDRAEIIGVQFVPTKDDLLSQSDILSIHMVLSPSTTGLLTATDLRKMKPTAYLVNTSRGPLVNEDGLLEVLREGKIAGAALDVFDVEPLPREHEFRRLGNVLLSPHVGYISDENYGVFWGQTAENVARYVRGEEVVRVLTPDRGMFE
jgi:phosphoglycerate dehydrogenase-like enzyme